MKFIPITASAGIAGVERPASDYLQLPFRPDALLIEHPSATFIGKVDGHSMQSVVVAQCLSMAKAAGLTVSPFYLSDNGQLLITKRFDINDQDKPIGFEDFCVLQGRSTKQKYDASLESCANTICQFVSPEYRKIALYDFFKLTVLNIILQNGDAHLKNYGAIYESLAAYKLGQLPKTSVIFSPVFDIVSTTPYIKNDTMALSLTGSKRWPKWKVLVKFGKQHCLLSNKEIIQIIDDLEQVKLHVLPIISDLSSKHKGFSIIAHKMVELLNVNITE